MRKFVDIVMAVLMIGVMSYQATGTGIYLSQTVFAPLLGMREAYLVRPFHVAAGAWGTIFVSIHAGMHLRLPEKINIFHMMAFILLVLAGSAAFAALDMPSRLIFSGQWDVLELSGDYVVCRQRQPGQSSSEEDAPNCSGRLPLNSPVPSSPWRISCVASGTISSMGIRWSFTSHSR